VWATDLGQRYNPPVEDGLALMADRFPEAGFAEEEIRDGGHEHTADRRVRRRSDGDDALMARRA
jgi:hypothetical protein